MFSAWSRFWCGCLRPAAGLAGAASLAGSGHRAPAGCRAEPRPRLLDAYREPKGYSLDFHSAKVLEQKPTFKGAVWHGNCILFHNSGFSNWWKQGFQVSHGQTCIGCNNSESIIMAVKECLASIQADGQGDFEKLLAKHASLPPDKSKAAAGAARGSPYPEFGDHALQVLLGATACLVKFSQNPDLREFLLSTGSAVLIEAAPHDGAWGVAQNTAAFLSSDSKPEDYTLQSSSEQTLTFTVGAATYERQVRDANALGKALMLVRAVLWKRPAEVFDELSPALEAVHAELNRTPGAAIRGVDRAHETLAAMMAVKA